MEKHMSHPSCEQVSLYALGALDGPELVAFEQHLGEGCTTCQQELKGLQTVVGQLGFSVKSVSPPPSLRQTILDRLHEQTTRESTPPLKELSGGGISSGLTFVRATDEQWKSVLPGIFLKVLYMDTRTGRMSALARMAPGSSYQAHRHTAPEEFYILEGSCFCGGRPLHVGDYHRAEVGSVHYETSSQEGCLMLIIFSPNNETLQITTS